MVSEETLQNARNASELIKLYDTLMEAKLDKKEICLVLYDLSAAFDTVCPK